MVRCHEFCNVELSHTAATPFPASVFVTFSDKRGDRPAINFQLAAGAIHKQDYSKECHLQTTIAEYRIVFANQIEV